MKQYPSSMSATRTVALWFALASVALGTACSATQESFPIAPATDEPVTTAPAPTCTAGNVLRSLGVVRIDGPASPDAPEAGILARGFAAVSAIVCEPDGATMTSVTLIETHRTGDLERVVEAYSRPPNRWTVRAWSINLCRPRCFSSMIAESPFVRRCRTTVAVPGTFTAIDEIGLLSVDQQVVHAVQPAQLYP